MVNFYLNINFLISYKRIDRTVKNILIQYHNECLQKRNFNICIKVTKGVRSKNQCINVINVDTFFHAFKFSTA